MDRIRIHAPAKLNFYLDVLWRRKDNYHQIQSVVQTITLHDTLCLERRGAPGITIICEHTGVPAGEENLVYRAAMLFFRLARLRFGLEVRLKKRIPIGAGLGGGSSDAAATLLALNELSEVRLPFPLLLREAARLGADVPFCLVGGTALIQGKGDFVYPLPALKHGWFVLVFPRITVSSAWAYEQLRYEEPGQGRDGRLCLSRLRTAIHPSQVRAFSALMYNRLEAVVTDEIPSVGAVRREFAKRGAEHVLMSGSGPTVFALLDTERAAQDLAHGMQSVGEVHVARPLARDLAIQSSGDKVTGKYSK